MKSYFDETIEDVLKIVRTQTKVAEQQFTTSIENQERFKKIAYFLENRKPLQLTFDLLYAVKHAGVNSQLKTHTPVTSTNLYKKIATALEEQIVTEHNANVKRASLLLKALPGLSLLQSR